MSLTATFTAGRARKGDYIMCKTATNKFKVNMTQLQFKWKRNRSTYFSQLAYNESDVILW